MNLVIFNVEAGSWLAMTSLDVNLHGEHVLIDVALYEMICANINSIFEYHRLCRTPRHAYSRGATTVAFL